MYVNRGILPSNDLSNEFLFIALAFGTFGTGARKALAGARAGIRAEFGLDAIRDILPAAVFRAASANGIAHTATSRIR
jgi:hypothetical protein